MKPGSKQAPFSTGHSNAQGPAIVWGPLDVTYVDYEELIEY